MHAKLPDTKDTQLIHIIQGNGLKMCSKELSMNLRCIINLLALLYVIGLLVLQLNQAVKKNNILSFFLLYLHQVLTKYYQRTKAPNLLPYFPIDMDSLFGPYHLVSHVTWTLCSRHTLIFVIKVSSFGAAAAVQGCEPNLTGLVSVAQWAAAAAAALCVILVLEVARTVLSVFLCGRSRSQIFL